MAFETTVILFKRDVVVKNLVGTVLSRFEKKGFKIRAFKMTALSDELLAEQMALP